MAPAPPKQTHGRDRRSTPAILLIGLLWLLAAVLLLEVLATVVLWHIERTNPRIAAAKKEGTAGVAAIAEEEIREAPQRLPVDRSHSRRPTAPGFAQLLQARLNRAPIPEFPDWLRPRLEESPAEKGARRRTVLDLSEADWRFFSQIHRELALTFDPQGILVRVDGNWPDVRAVQKRWDGLASTVRHATVDRTAWRAFQDLQCVAREGNGPVCEILDPFLGFAHEQRGLVHVFAHSGPASGTPGTVAVFTNDLNAFEFPFDLPADSPWDKPFFRYKSNLRDCRSAMGVRFDTNNVGFRDDSVAVPKPRGVFRILCIGGSTTEEGGSNETTYPNLVEAQLRKAFPQLNVEVVNCGTSGLDSSGHLARLPDYLELEPDLVVAYVGVNDVTRELSDLWATVESSPFRRLAGASRFMRLCCNSWLQPSDSDMRSMLNRFTVRNLNTLGEVFHVHRIPTAFCSLPAPDPAALTREARRYFDYDARTHWQNPCGTLASYRRSIQVLNEALELKHEGEHLAYIPLAEMLDERTEYFQDICHMTQRGIEQKARGVGTYLTLYLEEALSKVAVGAPPDGPASD